MLIVANKEPLRRSEAEERIATPSGRTQVGPVKLKRSTAEKPSDARRAKNVFPVPGFA
jgi:hypothetical protein